MKESIRTDPARLRPFVEGHPLLSRLAAESSPERPIYLAGGAVRDVLAGADVLDYDLVVESGAAELGRSLAPDALVHERFGTAELETEGHRVDIATSREETYERPGALPDVAIPAPIERDMARRDFTVNAMAVPLHDPERVIDPFGGGDDLRNGILRVLHERSFADDPTRALRAARYSARFGFDLDAETAAMLPAVDLDTVSEDRRARELELIAGERTGVEALRLVTAWGLLEIPAERLDLADAAVSLLEDEIWVGRTERADVVLRVIGGDFRELSPDEPETPYAGVLLAHGLRPSEALINRARGCLWLDRYEEEWSKVRLLITGDDLVLAGIPQGPAIGIGLAAALRAKLDRGIAGIEPELEIAVGAAEAVIAGE
ncbi:MAG TPA: hypothetical protein VMF31_03490 [Solirubrobacterales bacterium]|nr:hypothetical protein [Solirubrobacterales bacterium]